jgi:hypothetical protein
MQPFDSAGIVVVAITSANAVLPRIVFMKELLSCKPIHRPSTGSWITPRRSAEALEAAKALGEKTSLVEARKH